MDTNLVIISVVVAVIAAAPGIVALIAQRKKTGAESENLETASDKLRVETSDIIRKATVELSEQYKAEKAELQLLVVKLNVRISDLQDDLKDAYIEIRQLKEALKQANKTNV
jgi:hypothetical protein